MKDTYVSLLAITIDREANIHLLLLDDSGTCILPGMIVFDDPRPEKLTETSLYAIREITSQSPRLIAMEALHTHENQQSISKFIPVVLRYKRKSVTKNNFKWYPLKKARRLMSKEQRKVLDITEDWLYDNEMTLAFLEQSYMVSQQ